MRSNATFRGFMLGSVFALACCGGDRTVGGDLSDASVEPGKCSAGATRCAGNGVETCVSSTAGGVEWSAPAACPGSQMCSNGTCACVDACTEGRTQCAEGGVQTCARGGSGCTAWESPAGCGAGLTCSGGACVAVCTDQCTLDATQCSGAGLQTCKTMVSGCTDWDVAGSCPTGNTCSGGACVLSCTDQCTLDDERCSGTGIQTCKTRPSGCTDWDTPAACPTGQVCSGEACVTTCTPQCTRDAQRCSGTGIQTCKTMPSGCTDWDTPAACPFTEACSQDACRPDATDVDHDGYYRWSDCDDQNPNASPGAPEIPGDGVDNNCDLRVDEDCGDTTVCSPLTTPISLAFAAGTVTGSAPPGSIVVVYAAYRTPRVTASATVDAHGHFALTGRSSGELLVLQTFAAGQNPSGKVWMLSGPPSAQAPEPAAIEVTPLDETHARVSADGELRTRMLVWNLSSQPNDLTVVAGILPLASGYSPRFSGEVTGVAGDVLGVVATGLDNAWDNQAPSLRIPGLDVTPPNPPKVMVFLSGITSLIGYGEPLATISIVDTSSRHAFAGNSGDTGSVSFDLHHVTIANGDRLVAWTRDARNDSTYEIHVQPGLDVTSPLPLEALVVSASEAGQVRVTGRTELEASVGYGRVGAPATYVPATWSGHDTFAELDFSARAAPGDRLALWARDGAGLTSTSSIRFIVAADGSVAAPNGFGGNMFQGWHLTGYGHPGSTVRIFDASLAAGGAPAGSIAVTDLGGAFDVNLGWYTVNTGVVHSGDVLIVWSELQGQTSPRVLTTIDDAGNDVTPPVAPTRLSVIEVSTGTFLVTGRGEIGGTAHIKNLTRVVPDSQGSLTWDASGTETLGSFAIVTGAQRGDELRVWITDPAQNTGTWATLFVP